MKVQFSFLTNTHTHCMHICKIYFDYGSFTSPYNFNSLINSTDLLSVCYVPRNELRTNKDGQNLFLPS